MGDFNWITSKFLAFASPQHEPVTTIPPDTEEYQALPSNIPEILASDLPLPFKNVLAHFSSRRVGLVVRLNSELYSSSYFTALGIKHIDMIFEDCTCPSLPLVRQFIGMSHEMITIKNKAIAVHCKAGLGRTGCLIGAYLIYRYGFTATEIISFMRFMRPGMVVGPQQHWLHLNQGYFRQWWFEDTMREKLAITAAPPLTPGRTSVVKRRAVNNGMAATPPNNHHSRRAALGEIDHNEGTASNGEEKLPAPTPGQPRKSQSHRKDSRSHPYARTVSGNSIIDKEEKKDGENNRLRNSDGSESEEEIQLRFLAKRSCRTPMAASGQRSATYSANVRASYTLAEDVIDRELWAESPYRAPKTPMSSSKTVSGSISMAKVRASPRRVTDSKSESRGIRKVSGRISSTGSPARVK